MISSQSRKVLDQTGIDVVRAVYAKTLVVRVLPQDYNDPVQFSTGQVPLGEVDEWLSEYTSRQTGQAQSTRLLSIISIAIAVVSLIVAIVALLTRH